MAKHSIDLPDDLNRKRLLDTKQTAALYGISVPHLRRMYRAKKVPSPIQIGERKYGWPAGVVLDDIASKAAA